MVSEEDIERALKLHCPRRARHLCKMMAEEQSDNEEDKNAIYEYLMQKHAISI